MKRTRKTSNSAGIVGKGCNDLGRRRILSSLVGGAMTAALPFGQSHARKTSLKTCLYADAGLAAYGFPAGHPPGMDRQGAFLREARARSLVELVRIMASRPATASEISRFHTPAYVAFVAGAESSGVEMLDAGDTPVFPGIYPASANVVGAALDGLSRVMSGETPRSFQPIGGLHHARRERAAGFCVFNDLGVVIETLRSHYGVKRVAYVDIDVHHGDGVFYPFEEDPDLIFADIHQDGRSLFPGTGHESETGRGAARGTKLNIALKAGAGDADFLQAWPRVEALLDRFRPGFILFQCGADGLRGDPLAQLLYSAEVHRHAARRLRALADQFCGGRIMAFGGGGYDRTNLSQAWSAVLREFAS